MRLTGFWLLLCFICAPLAAQAQDGVVAVGGETLFVIKATADGESPAQRADAVTERLPVILGDPNIEPLDIHVVSVNEHMARILVKNRLLVTVLPEDAKINDLSVAEQAEIWADQLRKVLPQVNAKPNPKITHPAVQWVRGTVLYRERIALPPNAHLLVRLLDVSRRGGASAVISDRMYQHVGQVPISFALPYYPAEIHRDHNYIVDAEIRIDGRVRWHTTTPHPVLTGGHPKTTEIVLLAAR